MADDILRKRELSTDLQRKVDHIIVFGKELLDSSGPVGVTIEESVTWEASPPSHLRTELSL